MAGEKARLWASTRFWLGVVTILWVATAGLAGYFYARGRSMARSSDVQMTLQIPGPLSDISTRLTKAKMDLARPRMAIIENAIKSFQLDCDRLPDESEGGLKVLLTAPPDLREKWNGPYLKQSQLLDPWGNEYHYIRKGQTNARSFDIICLGADGQEGGEGENADIVNDD